MKAVKTKFTKKEELEAILTECHMALVEIFPALDAWWKLNDWLVANGDSQYAKRLSRILPKKRKESAVPRADSVPNASQAHPSPVNPKSFNIEKYPQGLVDRRPVI